MASHPRIYRTWVTQRRNHIGVCPRSRVAARQGGVGSVVPNSSVGYAGTAGQSPLKISTAGPVM